VHRGRQRGAPPPPRAGRRGSLDIPEGGPAGSPWGTPGVSRGHLQGSIASPGIQAVPFPGVWQGLPHTAGGQALQPNGEQHQLFQHRPPWPGMPRLARQPRCNPRCTGRAWLQCSLGRTRGPRARGTPQRLRMRRASSGPPTGSSPCPRHIAGTPWTCRRGRAALSLRPSFPHSPTQPPPSSPPSLPVRKHNGSSAPRPGKGRRMGHGAVCQQPRDAETSEASEALGSSWACPRAGQAGSTPLDVSLLAEGASTQGFRTGTLLTGPALLWPQRWLRVSPEDSSSDSGE